MTTVLSDKHCSAVETVQVEQSASLGGSPSWHLKVADRVGWPTTAVGPTSLAKMLPAHQVDQLAILHLLPLAS